MTYKTDMYSSGRYAAPPTTCDPHALCAYCQYEMNDIAEWESQLFDGNPRAIAEAVFHARHLSPYQVRPCCRQQVSSDALTSIQSSCGKHYVCACGSFVQCSCGECEDLDSCGELS